MKPDKKPKNFPKVVPAKTIYGKPSVRRSHKRQLAVSKAQKINVSEYSDVALEKETTLASLTRIFGRNSSGKLDSKWSASAEHKLCPSAGKTVPEEVLKTEIEKKKKERTERISSIFDDFPDYESDFLVESPLCVNGTLVTSTPNKEGCAVTAINDKTGENLDSPTKGVGSIEENADSSEVFSCPKEPQFMKLVPETLEDIEEAGVEVAAKNIEQDSVPYDEVPSLSKSEIKLTETFGEADLILKVFERFTKAGIDIFVSTPNISRVLGARQLPNLKPREQSKPNRKDRNIAKFRAKMRAKAKEEVWRRYQAKSSRKRFSSQLPKFSKVTSEETTDISGTWNPIDDASDAKESTQNSKIEEDKLSFELPYIWNIDSSGCLEKSEEGPSIFSTGKRYEHHSSDRVTNTDNASSMEISLTKAQLFQTPSNAVFSPEPSSDESSVVLSLEACSHVNHSHNSHLEASESIDFAQAVKQQLVSDKKETTEKNVLETLKNEDLEESAMNAFDDMVESAMNTSGNTVELAIVQSTEKSLEHTEDTSGNNPTFIQKEKPLISGSKAKSEISVHQEKYQKLLAQCVPGIDPIDLLARRVRVT